MRNALVQIEDQMVHSNWMPDLIMGINRGGCIPGVYLSHRLKKEHLVLDIRLRDHKATPAMISVFTEVPAFVKPKSFSNMLSPLLTSKNYTIIMDKCLYTL